MTKTRPTKGPSAAGMLRFNRMPLPSVNGVAVPATALDAQYAWAAATDFLQYGLQPDADGDTWFLVAFEIPMPEPEPEPELAALIQAHCDGLFAGLNGLLHPLWWNSSFVYGTALLDQNGLLRLEQLAATHQVRRFEVALAPESSRPAYVTPPLAPAPPAQFVQPGTCQEGVMFGVVDDGCPFASTRLRLAGGGTRVLDFWEQDGVMTLPGAGAPALWGFGSSADDVLLDALSAAHSPADDWAVYLEAGLPELCADASHGAHMLGCLLDANRNASLLWDGVRDRVPVAAVSPGPATPDLVFVQLPAPYVQGVPRGALSPYRLAGLRYILECAGPNTHRVVVPVSSEIYEGSHDGESLFDQACDALVEYAMGLGKVFALFVAAGNSLRTDTHDAVRLAPGATHQFRVRVLPGNERHTFVELWMPHALDGLQFDLQPPGAPAGIPLSGNGCWEGLDAAGNRLAGIVSLQQLTGLDPLGGQRCVTFIIEPTLVMQGTGAGIGDWVITVTAPQGAASEDLFAWIARSTPGVGGKVRSYQSTFPRHYSWDWNFQSNVPADADAPRPYDPYSLSGLATGTLNVGVGGYRLRRGQRALYSAGGPGRPPSLRNAFLIESAAPSDESRAVRGILGWGNRSAGSVRLAGTSVAAPFAARVFGRLGTLPALNPAVPPREDPQIRVVDILP